MHQRCWADDAVISGSKVKILKVNHNYQRFLNVVVKAVISGSKVKILKVNHNGTLPAPDYHELLSLVQR